MLPKKLSSKENAPPNTKSFLDRLSKDFRHLRKNKQTGYYVKLKRNPDGSKNLRIWECKIIGPPNTSWEKGLYPFTIEFPPEYPIEPPVVKFPAGFKHINVFDDGTVCLSLLQKGEGFSGWASSLSPLEIFHALQQLLKSPNADHITGENGKSMRQLYLKNRKKYNEIVLKQAAKYRTN